MPRVTINKKEYKLLDFKGWVRKQMALNHKTQVQVGKALGISQSKVSKMLKIPNKGKKEKEEKINPDPFTYGQVLTLCEFFEVDEEERMRLLMM